MHCMDKMNPVVDNTALCLATRLRNGHPRLRQKRLDLASSNLLLGPHLASVVPHLVPKRSTYGRKSAKKNMDSTHCHMRASFL